MLGIGLVLTYIAFFNYLKQAIDIIKGILARKKAAKEGAQTESAETDDAVAVVADKDEAEDTAVGEKNINAASDKEN